MQKLIEDKSMTKWVDNKKTKKEVWDDVIYLEFIIGVIVKDS